MADILASFWQSWHRSSGTKSNRRAVKPRARLAFEVLEDRTVPSAGTLDSTFGSGFVTSPDGRVITNFPASSDSQAKSVAIQPDGKIIVAGTDYTNGPFSGSFGAIRYNSDGTLDTSFGSGGFVPAPGFSDGGLSDGGAVAVLPDGNILLSGIVPLPNTLSYDGVSLGAPASAFAVACLSSTGSLVSSFGNSGVATIDFGSILPTVPVPGGNGIPPSDPGLGYASLTGMAIQSDGNIVVAGTVIDLNLAGGNPPAGTYRAVARLDSSGNLDPHFNGNGKMLLPIYYSAVRALALEPEQPLSDQILIAIDNNWDGTNSLLRVSDAGPQNAFAIATGLPTSAMTVQSDGNILLAGSAGSQFTVERLKAADGSVDKSFGTQGQTIIDFNNDFGTGNQFVVALPYTVAVQPDGKIVVAGAAGPGYSTSLVYNTSTQSAVVRLNSDGSLDNSYGNGGTQIINFGNGTTSGCSAVAIQPYDGNAVLAGTSFPQSGSGGSITVARLLSGDIMTQDTVLSQLNQFIDTANLSPQSDAITVQAASQLDVNAILAAIDNTNALPSATTPVTVTLDLGGQTYSTNGVALNPPSNVTLVVQNGMLDPVYPALTVTGGSVTVQNCTLLTTGDAPTILVTGGSLTLRNDVIQESTGFTDAAIDITGGTVDLGTAASPGDNTLNINGHGLFIDNTGAMPVSALGDTFEKNGTPLTDPYRIANHIFDALDAGGGGLVTYVAGNVYVTNKTGSIQRGVDAVAAGGTVNVKAGSYAGYNVGSKPLTIQFQNGPSLTLAADSLEAGALSLTVYGWATGDDKIEFNAGDAGVVHVDINRLPRGTFTPTGRLIAYGGAGLNDISVDNDIKLSAWLFAGTGNTRLTGGSGNNVLVGGSGTDELVGGRGRDLMIGGGGSSTLKGNGGDDILIGGYTTYDANDAALAAIMAEWTSADSFAQRIADLSDIATSPGFDQRQNGNYYLLANVTVFNDPSKDTLNSDGGDNWLFADAADRIQGLTKSDDVTLFS